LGKKGYKFDQQILSNYVDLSKHLKRQNTPW